MFKNMIKRSWLSIVRKPGRAVLIALLLFAMANLVLSSLAIKSAVAESMDYAKSALGGSVYLQADIEKIRAEQAQSGTATTPGTSPQFVRPTTSLSMVQSIADSEYVKDYTYSISAQAKTNGFTPLESQSSGFSGMRGGGSGAETVEPQLTGDISIQGINAYAFITGVQNETMKLSSGEYFDENSNDQAIISYDLAASNGLEVGDKITMQNTYDSMAHQVAIVGIYDLTGEELFGNPANTVYMNTATAAKYFSGESYNNGDFNVQNVRFELTDAEHKDAFIAQANEKFPNLESENLLLSIDTSAYDQMVGPIESVGSFATTIFWVVVIASVAIISLIVTINVKDRRYEMGVLLSLGATKLNVAAQILVELLVIGTVALVASVGTGTLVAKSMSEGLLANQMSLSEQQEEQNFGRPSRGGGFGGRTNNPASSQSDVEAIDSINVNATPSDFALLFAIGYGVIILALILPTWNIVKYQPKTILTGKE